MRKVTLEQLSALYQFVELDCLEFVTNHSDDCIKVYSNMKRDVFYTMLSSIFFF